MRKRSGIFFAKIFVLLAFVVPPVCGLADVGDIDTIAGDGGHLYSASDEGGAATAASITQPNAIAYHPATDSHYIATGNRIRRVDASGIITRVAGAGTPGFSGDGGDALLAELYTPTGLAVDSEGNLFIADSFNYRIRRVDAVTKTITTVAGTGATGNNGDGGQAQSAGINPSGMRFLSNGDLLIACSSQIRRIIAGANNLIDPTDLIVNVAGTGTAGAGADDVDPTTSALSGAVDVDYDGVGDIYLVERLNHRVRKVDISENKIFTVAGDGMDGFADNVDALSGRLNGPTGIEVDVSYNLFIADENNHRIRKVSSSDNMITTIGGTGVAGFSGDGSAATAAQLNRPHRLAFDNSQNLLFTDLANHRVREIESVAAFIPEFQPDCMAGKRASSLRGNNRYGGAGGQTVKITEKKRKKVKVYVRLQNDGNTDDSFGARVSGGSKRKFKPKWTAAGRNVTGALRRGLYVTPVLAVGESVLIRGKVRIRKPRGRKTYRFYSHSKSDAARTDSCVAKLKAKLKKK